MPSLNWDAFAQLPGSADANFEMLCRALIRRHYGKFGTFAALANQPGVEFHLHLTSDCSLGKSGRWFGWQCRWYDLPAGKPLGAARRKKIAESIALTEKNIPGLTDWVLWTRRTLTKSDQKWFYAIKTKLTLDLWTGEDVESHLSGDALIFRGTYFGELVLTPDTLKALQEQAISPIRQRWKPNLHQVVQAEREIRRLLGELGSWNALQETADQLKVNVDRVTGDIGSLEAPLSEAVARFLQIGAEVGSCLIGVIAALESGDFDLLRQQASADFSQHLKTFSTLPGRLRAYQHPTALSVTNTLADIRQAGILLRQLAAVPSERSVFVLAEAGSGKTQLSAELTVAKQDRPAGILLRGKDLQAGATLDDLAKRAVTIQGTPVPSFEALVAAVDAAGQRAKKRLPIVIDGLNEAEDPRDWKAQLARARNVLQNYPYVLLVGTLRPAFEKESLPADALTFAIPDFGVDALDAIRRYFHYYRINTTDFEFSIEFLSHPLTLFLFCEVANPKREQDVAAENMPASLSALFERYLEQVAERIAELASRTHRFYQLDVSKALYQIGAAIWEEKARGLDFESLRKRLKDDSRTWDQSMVRALEQEGVLLREPPRGSQTGQQVTAAYDALGGHLCANAMLTDRGGLGFEAWAKEASTLAAFESTGPDRHPLGYDIFSSLVGLFPRRQQRNQLWMFFQGELRDRALHGAAYLEGAYLDAETVNEIRQLLVNDRNEPGLYRRLRQTRGSQGYPLNSEFLNSALSSMSLAQRDLQWTEWVRVNRENLLADLVSLERRWQAHLNRGSESERLRAQWLMWLLTSTTRELRDLATRALYWFGRSTPAHLFQLTIDALSVNDPYVPERMLAASYGVCMALHCRPNRPKFRSQLLAKFARILYAKIFSVGAPNSTTHELLRDYAQRIIELADTHTPNLLTVRQKSRTVPPFKDGGIRSWQVVDDPNEDKYRSGNSPLGMDFANYTIGSLVPGRSNYNFSHPEYKKVVGSIMWRIYQLGYTLEAFGEIDKEIATSHYRDRGSRPPTERYGKKYARIAYFEQYGLRKDQGLLKESRLDESGRSYDSDLDPSFPDQPPAARILGDLLGDRSASVAAWVTEGPSPDFVPYLIRGSLGKAGGPWILLDGSKTQEDKVAERHGFVRLQCLLLLKEDEAEFLRLIKRMSLEGRSAPDLDEDHLAFAGEIAWCDTILHNEMHTIDFVVGTREVEVDLHDIRNILRLGLLARRGDGPVFETENVYRSIPVYAPVRRNSFSSAAIERPSAVVPSKELVSEFKLWIDLPSWNMRDENGQISSVYLDAGSLGDSEHHTFLEQQLIDRLLSSQALSLAWVVWGERQHYSEDRSKMENSPGYRNFRQVFRYERGRAVRVS